MTGDSDIEVNVFKLYLEPDLPVPHRRFFFVTRCNARSFIMGDVMGQRVSSVSGIMP